MDATNGKSEESGRDHISTGDVDVGAQLIADTDLSLTQHEASRLRFVVPSPVLLKKNPFIAHRAKIDWHIMPFMCSRSDISEVIRP
jgi:hypothetical protein